MSQFDNKVPPSEAEVILFTDGACSGNPGPGGWGFILRHQKTGKEIERSGGERDTTNNRMEMMAVIEGLKSLKRPTTVEVVSDSKYVLQGIDQWMPNWKRNGWTRKDGGKRVPVKNIELWQELDKLVLTHRLILTHVFGHAGHPENERCDQIAVAASKNLPYLPCTSRIAHKRQSTSGINDP